MNSYAGFWKRFLACLIDGLLLGAIGVLLLIPFFGLLGLGVGFADMENGDAASAGFVVAAIAAYGIAMMVMAIGGWLYYAFMESSSRQATLGKMALGIVVTDMNGGRITFGCATGRYFGKILSSLIFYIGYIMAGFTQQKQALHDILASTLVINKP